MFNPLLLLGKLPTGPESRLIVALLSGTSIVLGLVAIISALNAPSNKYELAKDAVFYGGGAIAFGVGLIVVNWLVERFKDYD